MYSKEELLDEIHRLAEGETPPTLDDLRERGKISNPTFYSYFESWNDALKQAGYQPSCNIGIETTLRKIRDSTDKTGVAPTPDNLVAAGNIARSAVHRKLGSYWLGVVRAGIKPHNHRPLTENQFQNIYATAKSQPSRDELVTLLVQFTGLPRELVSEVSKQWVQTRPDTTVLTVPPRFYRSGDTALWQIEIPETFQEEEIGLTGLLNWYLETYGEIDASQQTVSKIIYDVAGSTGIDRREVERTFSGITKVAPEVRPSDLKITSGIIMARNGAPASHIRQQLGLGHLNSDLTVDHIFTWCEVHDDDFSHPDHEPVGLYLDPGSGELCGE